MAEPMQVEVVCADRVVWSGKSSNIIAKTVEGDIGILPGHEPVLAVLVPGAVEIFSEDGPREIVAVDGGFSSSFPRTHTWRPSSPTSRARRFH